MTDLIRKSEADAAIVACKGNGATRQACRDAIAALPAVAAPTQYRDAGPSEASVYDRTGLPPVAVAATIAKEEQK